MAGLVSATSFLRILPICLICFFYLSSFQLFFCASNSLIYSTVCLLHANESFCSEIDQNKTLRATQETIQKESSQWLLYGTMSFALIACFISPIYGSLSDKSNRKLPIVLTVSNALLTGIIVTIASIFKGSRKCLLLYIVANIVNGFGGGLLSLISSCIGYAIDTCTTNEQHIPTIAIIEASINIGAIMGFVFCTFIFKLHTKTMYMLLAHILLLIIALLISLIFVKGQSSTVLSRLNIKSKLKHPFVDVYKLITDLKSNQLLSSFIILLISVFFYEIFRLGSTSISYLYLHRMSFNDADYATYFAGEQCGTFLALIFLALLRRRLKINDLHLCIAGLCLSLVGPVLFAFANSHRAMIFGAIPSMMFGIYFPVCIRATIACIVPECDKGKAFSFVALVQNLDTFLGSIICTEIYQSSIEFFPGLVYIFGVATRIIALILLVFQQFFIGTKVKCSKLSINTAENPINDAKLNSNFGDDDNKLIDT